MATAGDIKKYLMPYIGMPVDQTLSTTDDFVLMVCVNQALADLLGQRLLTQSKVELLRAPVDVTLQVVTKDSKALTFSTYDDSWMDGCSIKIGPEWNRLDKSSGTLTLEAPYSGESGTDVAATVYADSLTLDYTIHGIQGPVKLDDLNDITLVPHRTYLNDLLSKTWGCQPGQPSRAVMIDAIRANTTPGTRFLFDAPPNERHLLRYVAQIRAPHFSNWADTTPYWLPGGLDEQILYPVARLKLSSYPIFIGDRGEAKEDASVAMMQWQAFSNKGPQPGVLDIYG